MCFKNVFLTCLLKRGYSNKHLVLVWLHCQSLICQRKAANPQMCEGETNRFFQFCSINYFNEMKLKTVGDSFLSVWSQLIYQQTIVCSTLKYFIFDKKMINYQSVQSQIYFLISNMYIFFAPKKLKKGI